ncbi:MAG TPA: hypothetical protein P5181_07190 [Dermatophilaceae bacterium]|mgnify:CR=1 FL=1|nr:hypothetical protein [Dermatophilaceae bacterium]
MPTTATAAAASWATCLWHLDTAADLAETGDTITLLALAAQIRLTRAAYPTHLASHSDPDATTRLAAPTSIHGHLRAAADLAHPAGGHPNDLGEFAGLVLDLADTARAVLAHERSDTGGNDEHGARR